MGSPHNCNVYTSNRIGHIGPIVIIFAKYKTGTHYTPAQQRCWGVYWFHYAVRLSVRLSVPLPVTTLLRLQFQLNRFNIYTTYQATSESVSHVKFLTKLQNVNFWHFFLNL